MQQQDSLALTMPTNDRTAKSSTKLLPSAFDPDAAAAPGSGMFGLPFERGDCRVVLTPIPFDATVSYGHGTSRGPAVILEASMQVDLTDPLFGPVYQRGIFMDKPDPRIAALSKKARSLAKPIIDRGGAGPRDARAVKLVNEAGERVAETTRAITEDLLASGHVPGLVGGDHSTPLGAIRAAAEFARTFRQPMGLLHLDAHMDLRDAFEGFTYSHASIMFNVLHSTPNLTKLVQVGIRDYGAGEAALAKSEGRRVDVHFDHELSSALLDGAKWSAICKAIIKPLPEWVYISFDIDALDPALCPHTGTPVPGGLSFNQAASLLLALKRSGRRVVGFDLVEVCPGPDGDEWDANVGARMLYKLCGTTPDADVRD
jgi:agmatinase